MKHVWQKNLSTGENIRKRVEDRRNQIISTPGVRVDRTSHGVRIRLPKTRASSADASTYSFKVSATAATSVYVARGYCQYAANAYEAKGDSTLTVAATGSVYIALNIATGAWSDCTYAATASVPASSATSTTYIIADVTVTSGSIASVLQRHVGDIIESRV